MVEQAGSRTAELRQQNPANGSNKNNGRKASKSKWKVMDMKKAIVCVLLILMTVMLLSATVFAFDPQPEPPGIVAKYDQYPGVTTNPLLRFANLFPFQPSATGGTAIFSPLGQTIAGLKGFDPQPEPPGFEMHLS